MLGDAIRIHDECRVHACSHHISIVMTTEEAKKQ